jgi:ABC-type transport system involved in multi-copper enzyme maturation permease subunit
MTEFFLSAWRCGLRGRSFHAVFVLGVVLIGVAYLAGYFSPRQPKTVALDVGYSLLRFSTVLLVLFWIQDLVGKEIDRKTVIFALAYPVSRATYVVGRYLGVLALAAVGILILALLLWLAVLLAGGTYQQEFSVLLGFPYWFAVFGVWLDVAVVAAFALWIASLSTVPVLPLALGAAFAVAGRSLGAVQEYLAQGAGGDQALAERFNPLIAVIQWLLPDLSRLDWRPWPMYSVPPIWETIAWSCGMALGYIAVMLALAVRTFSKRELV